MQPIEPSPCRDEKRVADEINVEGTVDRQPRVPKPTKELVSCGVEIMLDRFVMADDKQPMEPRPSSEEKRAADEIKVEGIVDRQPIEPKPTKELVSCGVEIMLDRFVMADDKQPRVPKPWIVDKRVADEIKVEGTLDRQPRVPKPTKELVSCGVEIMLDRLVMADDKQPMEPSPWREEKRAADEIKLEGSVDKQPIEPKPTKELVSCGVEMMLDRLVMADDK